MIDWDTVEEYINDAKGIAFDTCHKIYVLMDDQQMAQMKEYEYDPLISKDEMSSAEMLATVQKWYEESCFLKFVEAVKTVEGDANEGFTTLIEQGASEKNEECYICGEEYCYGDCEERCDKCGYSDVWEDGMCKDCYDDEYEEDEDDD